MYAIRKVGTDELMQRQFEFGFTPAKDGTQVALFKTKRGAQYRINDAMFQKRYLRDGYDSVIVDEDGDWAFDLVPDPMLVACGEFFELEVVEVEVTVNVCN